MSECEDAWGHGNRYCSTHCKGAACRNLPFYPCCGACTPSREKVS